MPTSLKPWHIGIGVIVLALLWIFAAYNGFVGKKEAVDAGWAQVETVYQRRIDLVPNLVKTVQGAANFEQETLIAVTQARTKWMDAAASASDVAGGRGEQIAAAQQFDSALARLLVTVESYPQLRATQAFQDLMAQLEGTENRIAVARRDFNEMVRIYNVAVKRFPGRVLAGVFGFAPEEFFESTEGAERAPNVEFE